MSYLFLALATIWLFLGSEGAKKLAQAYAPLQERRLLLMRVFGFLAMSSWVHLLPSVLLVIYMREEGILSTEVLNDDVARPVIASLYLLAPTLAIAGASCLGAILAKSLNRRYALLSIWPPLDLATGLGSLILCYYVLDKDLLTLAFLCLIAIPLSLYFHLSILTDVDKQHRIFWAPFALICLVTATLFGFPAETYHVVSRQLSAFGSGGCADIKAHFKNMNFAGKLILLTEHSTYILVVADEWEGAMCTIRIPANEALIAHAYDSTQTTVNVVAGEAKNLQETTTSPVEEYSTNAVRICGPVGKTTEQRNGKTIAESNQSDLLTRRSCSTRSLLAAALTRWIPVKESTLPEYSTR